MSQAVMNPMINPLGAQADAIAGSQGIIFTETDRKLIKEIGGEIDKTRTFKELFLNDRLMHKVENEETTVKPEQEVKVLENRRNNVEILQFATTTVPEDRVKLTQKEEKKSPPILSPTPDGKPNLSEVGPKKVAEKTAVLAKELNLNPAVLFNKFALEETEFHNLICRIKELHLKRLLCSHKEEFEELTELIRSETLAGGRPEARQWLEGQLSALTKSAAGYKINLLKSMRSMGLNDQQENIFAWLKRQLSQA